LRARVGIIVDATTTARSGTRARSAALIAAVGAGLAVITCAPLRAATITVGTEQRKAVEAAVGETLVLRLPSTPGTGFTWRVAEIDADRVQAVGEPTYEPPPSPGLGAAGYQLLRFVPRKPGPTHVVLQYLRPWEGPNNAGRRFTLDIVAKGDHE
jgi:predicted secreted protein